MLSLSLKQDKEVEELVLAPPRDSDTDFPPNKPSEIPKRSRDINV